MIASNAAVAANPDLKMLALTGDPIISASMVSPLNGGGISGYVTSQWLNVIKPENLDSAQFTMFETAN